MTEILDLAGRVALVTGAGQNVGRQIALHLAAHNSGGIIVNDYFEDRAQAVAAEIVAKGGKAIGVQADVTNWQSVKAMVGKAEDRFGPIGVLVNNAGNRGATPTEESKKPFWQTEPEVWNQQIGVNFFGVLHCCAAIVPGMIARKAPGRIITIVSDAARAGDAEFAVYAGAKAGAAGVSRSLARALARYEITSNCIAISAIATPDIQTRLDADPERAKRMLEKYIVRRLGQPSDVANMALFLASEASSWISGQTYPVNGGYSLAL
jgi:2-hydroxycyclohexanecarboxyl-CoA dehydrogenase